MNNAFELNVADLNEAEIAEVDGGVVCGGFCIGFAAVAAGAGLFYTGVQIGEAIHDAVN